MAIRAKRLMGRPQERATRQIGFGDCVRLVAGRAGDGTCGRGMAPIVEEGHVIRVLGRKAVQKSHVGMVYMLRQSAFRAAARTVATGTHALAVVALRRQTLGPRPDTGGSRVYQMTRAAGAGFRRDLAAHVVCPRGGLPQVVSRTQDLPTLGMASEAQGGIRPRRSQQLWVLLALMNVMTSRAGNSRLRIADCGLRIRLAHVCRLHRRAGFPGAMAGFAETVGSLFTAERRPDAALLLRTVDRMTIETKRFGDETGTPNAKFCVGDPDQIFHPFTVSRIVHGTLDPQLILVAVRAEVFAERAKQRRGLRPAMRIMATITGDFRLRTRRVCSTPFSGREVRFRRREQGMMRSLRRFHPTAVVASTTEIGGGACR